MENINKGPFKPLISFRILKQRFEEILNSENYSERIQANQVLSILENSPELVSGTHSLEVFNSYFKEINEIMAYLFPSVLGSNEIKGAVFPYSNQFFYTSNRLKEIDSKTTLNINDILQKFYKGADGALDLIPYAIILNKHYGFNVDFEIPKQLKLDDDKGNIKNYRVTFNAEFMDIYPTKNAIEITSEILEELLANPSNINTWDKYFPENSWIIEGFGLISMIDTTLDKQIEDFKTHLIDSGNESIEDLTNDLRKIFNIDDLQVGSYRVDGDMLLPPFDNRLNTLTLNLKNDLKCTDYACNTLYKRLFSKHEQVIIPNVPNYHEQSGGNNLSSTLTEKNLKSAVLLPIVVQGKLQFIIELASYKVNQLNAINVVKLASIMPFILSHSERLIVEYENLVSAVIQNECTSIHPAVQWRFIEEAVAYTESKTLGETPVFNEVVFENVLPLFGQIDIVGSSFSRNNAIKEDLSLELLHAKKILENLLEIKYMPFYEQLVFTIDTKITELDTDFNNNTEQDIHQFFEKQIHPLFQHIISLKPNNDIEKFLHLIDKETQSFYIARKNYDKTIDLINKNLSFFLDKQQVKAQSIFPHYFEKYKTDGIEHNMYVGQSISKDKSYHESILYSLRLWQLQVMCEMETLYYQYQKNLAVKLDVASLILAYDVPLTIRYRIDEKQFDVDGAYNVRYEMIKKRIDKAHVKNTNERLTQAHKLAVVFSTKAIEREYLNYFKFLQSKNYIGDTIEIVELEELQGTSGIKAIRVDINQNLQKSDAIFSIADLKAII
tara:strand:+ start:5593 stop:7935 length:2343 start_codon:yes stop_codon:yes gene_type:complete